MKQNFDKALSAVLAHEGGWSDHPADPGGATMRGITKRTLEAHLGRSVTKDELREISDETVREIYRARYWDPIRGDELPSGVDYVMFDCAVNSGVRRSIRLAQKVVGAVEDGIIGPRTMEAIERYCARRGTDHFIANFSSERDAFLRGLPTFNVFGRGWSRRVDEVENYASMLAANRGVA